MENNYGNRSYQDQYRNRDGDWQNRNSDDDYSNRNRDRYRSENDWNNSQQSNRYQGNPSDRNNDRMEDNYGGNYGSGQNYNRYGNSNDRSGESRYGGSGDNQWNRGMNYGNTQYYGSGGNNYGSRNDGSNRDNDNNRQGNHDRDWWDKTSDEISSWFGDDDAKRRRRMDKIMGPHRGKGPKGYTRSDEKIREDVNEKLYHDSHIDASDIEVTVSNGEVTLSGMVENRFAKRHAEDLAETVAGVTDVSNNIKVNKTQSYNTGTTNMDTSSSANRSGMNGITDNNDTNRRRTISGV